MELKICFLGTGCAMPTKQRSLASIAIKYLSEILLFECPEGIQKQLMLAKLNFMRIKKIFISHWHADHVLGFAGLIATMIMHERTEPLDIFAPKNVERRVSLILRYSSLKPEFKLKYHSLKEGLIVKEENYSIKAFKLMHSTETYGFVFKEKDKIATFDRNKAIALGIKPGPLYAKLQRGEAIEMNGKIIKPADVMDFSKGRPGRKVSILLDTRPCKNAIEYIKNSDILIHDAAFLSSESSRAIETMHSTALEAAELAKQANCKKLYLINFSPRYRSAKKHLEEAKSIFQQAELAEELFCITIPMHRLQRVLK